MFYSRATKLHMTWHTPHFVTFLDILGFSTLIKRIREEPELFFRIRDALGSISRFSILIDRSQPIAQSGEKIHLIRAKHFSDSIILSVPAEHLGCLLIVESTAELVTTLLSRGVLVRGGIACGHLFHDDVVVFGEGLIAAYRLESELADFPRVLIEKTVAEMMSSIPFFDVPPSRLVTTEVDGQLALDFLHAGVVDVVAKKRSESRRELMTVIATTLQAELCRDVSERVRRKLTYLTNYFNRAVERLSLPELKVNDIVT